MARLQYVVTACFVLVASCSGGELQVEAFPSVTTSPIQASPIITSPVEVDVVTTSPVVTSAIEPGPVLDIPPQLGEFGIGTIRLDGTELLVAIADNDPNRTQGLMNVADLGSLDGMVFVWPEDTDRTFWMRDTVISLDIAWFDGEGRFVSQLVMAPCEPLEICPHFAADRLYRFALEMPEGTMPSLSADSRLDLVDGF